MKRFAAILMILLIISTTVRADLNNDYFSDNFTIFPSSKYNMVTIDDTPCYQKPFGNGVLYIIFKETEVDVSFNDLIGGKLLDALLAFEGSAHQGEFETIDHVTYRDLFPVPYTVYKTSTSVRCYCCFPGEKSILAMILSAPPNCDPIPELKQFIETIFPRLK